MLAMIYQRSGRYYLMLYGNDKKLSDTYEMSGFVLASTGSHIKIGKVNEKDEWIKKEIKKIEKLIK